MQLHTWEKQFCNENSNEALESINKTPISFHVCQDLGIIPQDESNPKSSFSPSRLHFQPHYYHVEFFKNMGLLKKRKKKRIDFLISVTGEQIDV